MNRSTVLRPFAAFALPCLLLTSTLGCGGSDQPAPRPGKRAKGREGDPALVHNWKMPADKSVLESADLGSDPPALADAFMTGSGAPGISHRIANTCATEGVLAGVATIALRFSATEAGAIEKVEGDPAGKAADCLVKAFQAEVEGANGLPAGAALMVLRFHPPKAR
ncbi:MAG: hypothetical protein AAF799_18060 [Myxococcota bacterium]